MTTVFLSGSRKNSRLNEMIRSRINNMIDQGFQIIVGDANGADKALQKFLADVRYSNVVVFCSGQNCRNNIGGWKVRQVSVDSKLKGRDFHTQKDKKMATEADYGFVLWDGKSPGSINNVLELLKRGKSIVVYFSPEKQFHTISNLDDANKLLEKCDKDAIGNISRKIKLSTSIKELEKTVQGNLNL